MISKEMLLISPELWVAGMACLILLLDVYTERQRGDADKKGRWLSYVLCQLTLIVGIYLILRNIELPKEVLFFQNFVFDPISNVLKIFIFAYGIFGFIYARKYVAEHQSFGGEYYILALFSILGMMILVSAYSYLSLYLGIELLTLPLYALIAMSKQDKKAPEAAMKYFVMGAIASGMLLFGISLLYGVTASFEIAGLAQSLAAQNTAEPNIAILCGIVFILAGLAFKLGAVPFHMWIPDVYQGSPTSVTLFIATLPKLAGFGMAIRILLDTFPALSLHWQPLLVLIAILSLALGNVAALAQSNIKRMLAYSTIGHIGFVFLGLLAGPDSGYAAALVYMIIYTLMALGAFGIIIALSQKGFEAENISDFKGLASTQPLIAFLMLLMLFSLAGVPPTAGFYAKFIVLDALINAGYVWLAIVAVIFSVIGAFYYLRVIRVMFFEAPQLSILSEPSKVTSSNAAFLSVNGLFVLGLGIFPAPLIDLCYRILQTP